MRHRIPGRSLLAVLPLTMLGVAAPRAEPIPYAGASAWSSIAEGYARPAAAQPTPAAQDWLKTLNDASRTWVRRLPVAQSRLNLQGERAVRKVPTYFSAADAARATEFRVGAVTSVAALDNASGLDVFINGVLLGTIKPRFDAPAEQSFPLQPGYLVEGFNEVSFVAHHQHRIDCTVAGSFELWTQVVPQLTGIVGNDTAEVAPAIANLPSLVGRADDPTTLKVRLPRTLDEQSARRTVRFVDALVLNGWIDDPRIVVDTAGAEASTGIEVQVAASRPVAAAGHELEPFADVPSLFIERDARGATTALVIAGDGAEIDSDLALLEERARARIPHGSPEGVRAVVSSFGTELSDASSMTLASLGIDGQQFRGRRFRLDIPTLLPGDYYQADYGHVLLYLDGGYAGGLVPGSLLKIKVNDVETVTLPLEGSRPETFDGKEIRIPLGMFHAGMNTLSIEAELLTESDASCAPENAPVMTPRLTLADTTRIVVPRMARVGVAPNLSATFSHGYPYMLDEAPTAVFIAGDRAKSFATAVALLAEITSNAQRTKAYDIAFRVPTEDETGILVGPSEQLPAFAAKLLGMRLDKDDLPADESPTPVAEAAAPVQLALLSETATDAPSEAFTRRIGGAYQEPAEAGMLGSVRETVGALLDRAASIDVSEQVDAAAELLFGGFERENKRRTYTPTDVVFAQTATSDLAGTAAFAAAVIPHAPPRTWTVVAADDPAILRAALDGVSDAGVRFNPSGQYYVYGEERDKTIAAASSGVLYATRAPGPINLRLVAAGWLSKHVRVYVLLIVPITLGLGLVTFVAARRRRADRTA